VCVSIICTSPPFVRSETVQKHKKIREREGRKIAMVIAKISKSGSKTMKK
jgi:hypothetical protein